MLSRQSDNTLVKMYPVVQTKLKHLTCANCKHTFCFRGSHQFRGKIPLLLECGHPICEICVKTSPSRACGSCGMEYQNNLNEQATFSVNLYLLGLITSGQNTMIANGEPNIGFQQSTAARLRKSMTEEIEQCSECGLKAESRCRQCNVFFCNSCYTKIHGRALQNHQRMSLIECASDLYNFLSNKCELHPNEAVEFFCDQCDVSACTHCLLLSHQGHNISSQSDQIAKCKPQIEDAIERLGETLQRIKLTEKKLAKPLTCMNTSQDSESEREKVEARLAQHFVYLHGVLQNIEKRLTKELLERQNFIGNNINAIKEQLKEQKEETENAILLANAALNSDSAVNVTAIIDKLEQALSMPHHLVRSCDSDDKLELHIDKSIVESLQEHCSLDLPAISSYCLVRTEDLPEDYEIEPIIREEITKPLGPALRQSQMSLSRSSLYQSTVSLRSVDQKQDPGLVEGSMENVKVTHIKDPSCFYTQAVCRAVELNQLHKALAKQACISPMPAELELNKLYLVQYESDMKWYRGRVKSMSKDDKKGQICDVFYIDYGNTESAVPLTRMRNMSVQSSLVPIMARQCTLHDIVPKNGQWEVEANKSFYRMIEDTSHITMHVFKVQNDIYHVDLTRSSSSDGYYTLSIRDALIFLEYGTFVTNEKLWKTSQQQLKKFFEVEISVENTYDIRVTHIESPDCIYAQKIGDGMAHLSKLTSDMMTEYGMILTTTKGVVYTPQIGMPCAAMYTDGTWYRGTISNLLGNQMVEVFFVDYGNKGVYKYNEIRRLHYKFMTITALAFRLSLKDVAPLQNNEWDPEVRGFMADTLMSKFLKIFVFTKESESYKVTLLVPLEDRDISFNAVLVQEKFAVSTGTSSQYTDFPKALSKKRKKRKGPKAKKTANGLKPIEVEEPAEEEADDTDPFRMQVNVLDVLSPDCIYVADVKSTRIIQKMSEEIQDFYNKYKAVKTESWKKNDVCIAYSAMDKLYHRARIIDLLRADKAVVFLYDMGLTETISMENLQALHTKFTATPARAVKVKLAGILPCGGSTTWLSSSSQVLHDLINENQHSRFYISKVGEPEGDALSVVLWVRETRHEGALSPTIVEINSVNKKLVKKGVALPVRGYKDDSEKQLVVELRQQLLQREGSSVSRETETETETEWVLKNNMVSCHSDTLSDVSVKIMTHADMSESDIEDNYVADADTDVDSYEEFPIPPPLAAWIPAAPIIDDKFCAVATNVDYNCTIYLHSFKQNSDTLALIDTALQTQFHGSKPKECDMKWAPNDLCIAQYHADKKWYRAQVLEVLDNDEIKVIFVDYGNIDDCKLGTLRKRVIMGHIPIQATRCVIQGLIPDTPSGKWSTPQLDVIHALMVDKKNDVTVLQRNPEHLVISMTLRAFKNVDLVHYLTRELKFKIIDPTPTEVLSLNESRCGDSEIESLDNADVVIEEEISTQGRMPEGIGQLMFNHYLNQEPVDSTETEGLLCEEIISGAMNISDNQVRPGSDVSFKTIDSNFVLDETEQVVVEGMDSFNKSINVSSTPQNDDDDEYLTRYTYADIPDDGEVVFLDPQHVEDTVICHARLYIVRDEEYLRSMTNRLDKLRDILQKIGDDLPKLEMISLNVPCIAKFTEDDAWYRGEIIEIIPDSNIVKVRYVEYGNSEYQAIDNLRSVPAGTLLAMPVKCFKFRLWRVKVNPQNPSWIKQGDKFKVLYYNGIVAAKVKGRCDDVIDVELYADDDCTKLLYDHLLDDNFFQIEEE